MTKIRSYGDPYSFRHRGDTTYELCQYSSVVLIVRAYGASALVVDKHQTTMIAKSTTNIDRFDRHEFEAQDGSFWIETTGPRTSQVSFEFEELLNKVAVHHTNYLAKLVVE